MIQILQHLHVPSNLHTSVDLLISLWSQDQVKVTTELCTLHHRGCEVEDGVNCRGAMPNAGYPPFCPDHNQIIVSSS